MKIVLFGPPAAGKGTFAGKLKKVLPDHPHISTGDIFRENIKNETPIGKKAKEYINAGKLVPDEVTNKMVEERINRPDCESGFILDGFPRTVNQMEALDEITKLDRVIEITATREEVIERVVYRVSCPKCGEIYNLKSKPPKKENICDNCGAVLEHRADDNEETMIQRLDTYESQAGPILKSYRQRGILIQVDGSIILKLTESDIQDILDRDPLPPK